MTVARHHSRKQRRAAAARVRRCRRSGHQGGQTTVEFGFMFVILLMCLLGTTGAAIWAVQSMDATTGIEDAARLAVGSTSIGYTSSTNNASIPDLAEINAELPVIQSGMLGTKIKVKSGPPAGGDACNNWLTSNISGAEIGICDYYYADPNNNIPGTTNYVVVVEIKGCMNSMVPTYFSIHGCADGIPIDQYALIHSLTFQA